MKKAIQFGAGNIGRGFIGYLLSKSFYEVTFCDVNKELIDMINERKSYNLLVKDLNEKKEEVKNIRGILIGDGKLIDSISKTDIITTAVGINILPKISEVISLGIKKKIKDGNKNKLNIVACENGVNATNILRDHILKYLTDDEKNLIKDLIGFPNASVDRIVPKGDNSSIDVMCEEFFEWNVEEDKIVGELFIEGMNKVSDLSSYIERKLFTLNTGHAMTSYLGFNKGYKTIYESISDDFIYENVLEAMKESGEGLILKYNFDRDSHIKYIHKIINRFKNPYLEDEVLRVGRDPIRKLGKNDRFIKPILTSNSYGKKVDKLCLGVAYALRFLSEEDKSSIDLQNMIKEKGVKMALREVSSLDDDSIINKIISYYNEIR